MRLPLVVDGYSISNDSDCYVIAEIGHNHQGDVAKARDLFDAAKQAGAHAVKLQKRDNRAMYAPDIYNSRYDNRNSFGATYGEHREFLEFDRSEYQELVEYARDIGITLFATAFDPASADFLSELDMPAYKIASGDIDNLPLLKHVAKIGKPTFVSTGGATMDEVQTAYDTIMPINQQLCIMQCTSGYPTEVDELNLRVVETYRQQFPDIQIGLSMHDNGISMPIAGLMLGAAAIEKHFTLNRSWRGTDQAFSLEPSGLRRMVRDLKRTRMAMGDGQKRPLESEKEPLKKQKKSITAARSLPAGHIVAPSDLAYQIIGTGLPPGEASKIVGSVLIRNIEIGTTISFDDLASS